MSRLEELERLEYAINKIGAMHQELTQLHREGDLSLDLQIAIRAIQQQIMLFVELVQIKVKVLTNGEDA